MSAFAPPDRRSPNTLIRTVAICTVAAFDWTQRLPCARQVLCQGASRETDPHDVTQAGLELATSPPPFLSSWYVRPAAGHLAVNLVHCHAAQPVTYAALELEPSTASLALLFSYLFLTWVLGIELRPLCLQGRDLGLATSPVPVMMFLWEAMVTRGQLILICGRKFCVPGCPRQWLLTWELHQCQDLEVQWMVCAHQRKDVGPAAICGGPRHGPATSTGASCAS